MTLRKNSIAGQLLAQKQLLFMTVPLILYVLLFSYVPLWGWTMSFQNYRPSRSFFQQEWVGLQWFHFLFTDRDFLRVLRNTLAMSLINMVLGYVSAILLALLLNEVKNWLFKRVVQTISYLPHFLSMIIVTGLVASMLSVENGTVNNFLLFLGIIKEPVPWLSEPKYFWGIIGVTFVWKDVGWNTIIYLAAMASIDPTLYEASDIDGCNRYHKMWHITLPGIKATITILLIMSIGRLLDAGFELQYLLRNGMIQDVAETIDIYVITYGLENFNYSLATTAGMFKNTINIGLILFANWLAKRMGEERLI
ncbi:MAG: ABC transporter permease subunit [Treponema sp.]|jgi:putative aldouronate transport system permease protein|nr:ABC transporter permease subunit [Treponema sp.]